MSWRHLKLSSCEDTNIPTLLLATKIRSSSYEIYLTDLIRIWSESLSHLEIRKRSYEEYISIDPSTDDQLAILLDKIDQALSGRPGTALHIRLNDEDNISGSRDLVLQLHVDLPKSLSPLEWPVRLSVRPPALLAEILTLPLLGVYRQSLRNLDFLTQSLKQKDHVIEKLLEKFEEQGIDLGQVFPQILGKQRGELDRESALKKVRGLAKFDFKSWKMNQDTSTKAEDVGFLFKNIFEDESDGVTSLEIISCLDGKGDWWKDVKGTTFKFRIEPVSTKDNSQEMITAQTRPEHIYYELSNIDNRRDFREQSISDNLSRNPFPAISASIFRYDKDDVFNEVGSKSKRKSEMIDNETDSGDAFSPLPKHNKNSEKIEKKQKSELQLPQSHDKFSVHEEKPLNTLSHRLEPKKGKGKLMVLKGKKKRPTLPNDSITEKIADSKTHDTNNLQKKTVLPVSPAKKRRNLGIIKGTKKKSGFAESLFIDPKIDSKSDNEKQQHLQEGKIDNNIKNTKTPEFLLQDFKHSEEKKIVNEDSLEKANRKRAELRKELELKMASKNPVKKTRHF
ncbi:putative xlf family protein [Erysiphe neolycopersici]|uniref:Non-homologous end-joining factor 1 n=1 Tax=Erysiphe neolycopersici TaxID=212602 RepID=A0A420I3R9_9PEZI|nr:putative xlf family protein [Erysiphe neolycopersici]